MSKKPRGPMLCPNCLETVTFEERTDDRRTGFVRQFLACPECENDVPRMYVDDYRKFPPAVASAVGFTQHGKSVYLSSLFYQLRHMGLAERWPNFFTQCTNDESLAKVWQGVQRLKQGRLPDATPKVFPQPTMLRIGGFPGVPDRTLIMYDTAGESFERPSHLIRHARFVTSASTVLFFVSLLRIRESGEEYDDALRRLLETYVVGVRELGAVPKTQRLKIVFTMADSLEHVLADDWHELREYLVAAKLGEESSFEYSLDMKRLSAKLERISRERLHAHNFLNLANGFFRSVSFCVVSALGTAPEKDNTIATQLVPRRVFDPILDVLRAKPKRRSLFAAFG